MKVSRAWLQRYVDLGERSDAAIAEALTLLGFEVEGIEQQGLPPLEHVVVGEIVSFEQHPNADRLSVCQVAVGDGEAPRTIVCGAKNFKAHDRVLVALPGAVLPGDFRIERSKLRGVASEGMLCSERELGLGEDHKGIAILDGEPALGTPINALYDDTDAVFDLEITPNRPDALSHIGIARELAAWFELPLAYPEIRVNAGAGPGGHLVDGLEVEDTDGCPQYRGYSIRGVTVGESPDWLKRALTHLGLRPVNNVVDATNFVLFELGQPLHAFDAQKIAHRRITVRRAAGGEAITTLDGKTRDLAEDMLVIADPEKPLVVAGVMGSIDAEVDADTTEVFLEAALFRAGRIRRTARALQLSSDSAYRFERGVDPEGLDFAALRCVDLILELAGGELLGPPLVVGLAPPIEREVELSPDFVRARLGFDISDEAMAQALRRLEFDVREHAGPLDTRLLRVAIPSHRLDVYRPIDLVEEILRVHGTDKVPEGDVRSVGLDREDAPAAVYLRSAAARLVGRGFHECMHYSLRNAAETALWSGEGAVPLLALDNPLASDASHLRGSLLPGLLDALALNLARHNALAQLFETGRVFREDVGAGGVRELVTVAFVLLREPPQDWKPPVPPDFYTCSQLVRELLVDAGLRVGPEALQAVEHPVWQAGHAAQAGASSEGWALQCGLLDLKLTRDLDIPGGVYAGEVVLTNPFLERARSRPHYAPFSGFPPATRDLALLVAVEEPAGAVQTQLEALGAQTVGEAFALESVEVFDDYRGEGVPAGQKSLAYRLRYRSAERTLKDKEVNKAFDALQARLKADTAYTLRT